MTDTVAKNNARYKNDGTLERPYGNSVLTIQSIIDSADSIPDPQGVPGAVKWTAPGSLNGTSGTYELVVDLTTNKIIHFLFTKAG